MLTTGSGDLGSLGARLLACETVLTLNVNQCHGHIFNRSLKAANISQYNARTRGRLPPTGGHRGY